MTVIRKYDEETDTGVLEFKDNETVIHIGSVTMHPLFSKEAFLNKFADGLFLAVEEEAVVGAILIGIESEEDSPCVVVYGIKVDPSYRRRGIGYRLMRQVDTFLKESGLTRAILHTRPDNTPAQRLFRNCGFAVIKQSNKEWTFEKRV